MRCTFPIFNTFTIHMKIRSLDISIFTISVMPGDTESEASAEAAEDGATLTKSERSHLVVWQVTLGNSPLKNPF